MLTLIYKIYAFIRHIIISLFIFRRKFQIVSQDIFTDFIVEYTENIKFLTYNTIKKQPKFNIWLIYWKYHIQTSLCLYISKDTHLKYDFMFYFMLALWIKFCCIFLTDLWLAIFLSFILECEDYFCVLPHPAICIYLYNVCFL